MESDDTASILTTAPEFGPNVSAKPLRIYGRPISRATDYKYWLEEVGFAEIREMIYKRPTHTWPKDRQLKEIGNFSY